MEYNIICSNMDRKNLSEQFDSFTSEHKLRNAQEEFVQAVYQFRAAEQAKAPNLIALKREMELLDRKVEYCRQCVYAGLPVEEYAEWSVLPKRCPEPAWV